jgi:hypothetical protein
MAISTMLLSVISVLAFCICCRLFIHAIRKPLPVFSLSTYSKRALRVRRGYEIFAWGLMTTTFLFALVVSFVQVYTTL